jgi:fused signal recognition particle receptor
MKSWLQALSRTRETLAAVLARFRPGARIDHGDLDALESALLGADLPPATVQEILDRVRQAPRESVAVTAEHLLLEVMGETPPFLWTFPVRPLVVLVVGVNGAGKTTTTAKLAWQAQSRGLKPLLAAADTYRAAGTDQARIWAKRVGCEVVSGVSGADPASVAYDAVQAAVSRGLDAVFIDTAGRMHTRRPLMDELQKMHRSAGKSLPGAPHHTWLVLDATLGSNAVSQARFFHNCIPLTAVVVAKLDGSAKAGFLVAIRKELGVPILFAGMGEGMDDLVPFDARTYVKSLVGTQESQ